MHDFVLDCLVMTGVILLGILLVINDGLNMVVLGCLDDISGLEW